MEPSLFDLKSTLEALIFAADEPIPLKQLEELFNEPQQDGTGQKITGEEIRRVIGNLNAEYEEQHRAYRIIQVGGGYQFATRPEYAEWVGKLYKEKGKRKLSHSALETLSIIAYRQPVTKPEIESIRGVNCDYVLHTLLERRLVTIIGRASTVGRPLLYGTTKDFLKHFGINEISELPKPREIEEIIEEEKMETEKQILDADRIEERVEETQAALAEASAKVLAPSSPAGQPEPAAHGPAPPANSDDRSQAKSHEDEPNQ